MHHPFTSAKPEHLELLDTEPERVIANAYDLVLNGNEIGGGSIRIHDFDTQMKIFELLGMRKEEYISQFGFLIDALKYGAPPHGGIAPGIDRIVMLLANEKNIREVTMFPMNQNAQDLMMNAPSDVEENQLKELNLSLKLKK